MNVKVYTESSDNLIADVNNVIYFECFRSDGNPCDMEGEILNVEFFKTKKIISVITIHEGRGKSEPFIPKKKNKYFLHIISPECKNDMILLPPYNIYVYKINN